MDNPLGIYEKALLEQPLLKKFEDAARTGYRCFEISIDETDARLSRLDWKGREFTVCKKAARDNGLNLFSVCLSGHRRFPLGSGDRETEKEAKRIMQAGIQFCGELGVRVLQVAGYDVFYEPSTEDTKKRYLENLKQGADLAAKEGVMLALEPVETHVTSVRKALQIVRAVDSPG
jgi:L-ribulose-5-phosphate 3-epimerase UlaE